MSEPLLLRDASVQDIQMELLRRTNYNALNGEKVAASLLNHRRLWVAALLDRVGGLHHAGRSPLLTAGLIKLRDLPGNLWNADTLFLLTPTRREACELAKVAEEEEWAGEVRVSENQEDIDRALGEFGEGHGLLSVWWD